MFIKYNDDEESNGVIPITSLSKLFSGVNPGFCPSSTLENSYAGAGVIPITWLSKLSIGVI
jgi:hypothetical protein